MMDYPSKEALENSTRRQDAITLRRLGPVREIMNNTPTGRTRTPGEVRKALVFGYRIGVSHNTITRDLMWLVTEEFITGVYPNRKGWEFVPTHKEIPGWNTV